MFFGLSFFILYANSDNNFLTSFDLKNSILFFMPSNFCSETIVVAPFLIASSMNLLPSDFVPLIAKKI